MKNNNLLEISDFSELENLFDKYSSKKNIILKLSDNYFNIDDSNFLDENIYNYFSYNIKIYNELFYALKIETLDFIIQKAAEKKVGLTAIYSKTIFDLTESDDYNFLREKDIEILEEFNLKTKNYNFLFIIFYILIFTFFIIIYFSKEKFQNEKINLQNEISKSEENILEFENQYKLTENDKNEILDFSNLIPSNNKKFGSILNKITNFKFNLYIIKIEALPTKIKVDGYSDDLEEIYKYQHFLEKNGFTNVNNSIINNDDLFNFTIDMEF